MMPGMTVQLNPSTVAYEVHPVGPAPAPGVIVVHEVTGLNDYVKEVAENVAKRDFVALAVDLYEGKTAQGMEDGMPLREKVTEAVFRD
jgi:dienelactone hydrolase